MKNLVIFICFLFVNGLARSQPIKEVIDINQGSTIKFDCIKQKENILVIKDWLLNKNQTYYELYILNDKTGNMEDPFKYFFIKKSEMDNDYKVFYFIYNDNLMTLKVKKNKSNINIVIKEINFKKGIYILNLEELYNTYGRKESFEIGEFP